MSIVKEFKEFAMKGNVVDLAVGVIIGAAFGKIVSSLVADVVMPLIGVVIGGVSFVDLKFTLKDAGVNTAGKAVDAVTLNYGTFIQSIFDFTIIAIAIFSIVKIMNAIKRKEEKKEEKTVRVASKEEELLTEIRDLLKK